MLKSLPVSVIVLSLMIGAIGVYAEPAEATPAITAGAAQSMVIPASRPSVERVSRKIGTRIDFDLRWSINKRMPHYATSSTPAVFLLACLVLAVTPGPAVIYLVTRTLSQGRAAGLSSIGGVALGNLGNAIAASFGLALIFAVSARAFMFIKLLGAGYLVYLGLRELRLAAGAAGAKKTRAAREVQAGARGRAFRDGFWVALLNPKTALFFAAFLPQFIDPRGSPLAQSLSLAAVFILVAVCTDTLYVLAAGTLGPKLVRFGGRSETGRYVTGLSFIALGVFVACAGNRTVK
jgi:threonine/homoserine/homoserine lactone efflux protein